VHHWRKLWSTRLRQGGTSSGERSCRRRHSTPFIAGAEVGFAPFPADRVTFCRLSRQIRRALIAADGPLTTPPLARHVYRTIKLERWHYDNVRRSARRFAVELYRRRSPGTPIVWVLKR